MVSRVPVVLVFDHALVRYRRGLNHPLVVWDDLVPGPGQERSHIARHGFCPVHLLWAMYPEVRAKMAFANAPSRPAMAFGPIGVPTVRCGMASVVQGDPEYVLCLWEDSDYLLCLLGSRFVWLR